VRYELGFYIPEDGILHDLDVTQEQVSRSSMHRDALTQGMEHKRGWSEHWHNCGQNYPMDG
jgi:hypothetical protein